MTTQTHTIPDHGAVIEVPLNRLKASPRNARRTPHAPGEIEALAASIAVKGLIQPPVVEPELDGDGGPTGFYLVTVGEGRRQALRLRAKRRQIGKGARVRCIVDRDHDAHEISLDENVTRFAMHPADQFEAFQRLATEQGFGPEDIAARFGVTATVVRQRLKLALVSPRLMAVYRQGDMSLDQLMAFTLTDDHARQETVWAGLSWNKEPTLIRRMLTQDRVRASERRAVFVGPDVYLAAGGGIERDLFADDHGGFYTDPALLDQLVLAKLTGIAEAVRNDGWKWATPSVDVPPAHGLRRVYPHCCDLSPEDQGRMEALTAEYDRLVADHEGEDEIDEAVSQRFDALSAEIEALNRKRYAYDPGDVARAGAFVVLGSDGAARIEAGFVRPEDEPKPEVQPDGGQSGDEDTGLEASEPTGPDKIEDSGPSPLSDRLVADLTAHRTAAIRERLGDRPEVALAAVAHALALQAFRLDYGVGSCLELRLDSTSLGGFAPGVGESLAGQGVEARHARWAAALPTGSQALWRTIHAMTAEQRLALLAHCVSLSVNAVRGGFGRRSGLAHADDLASALALDMADYWTPTQDSYLGRVTKAHILAAVSEGVSPDAARRIEGLTKEPMAEAAAQLLTDRRWLPSILRTLDAASPEPSAT